MGTRADFYVGKGKNAQWLASIAWDGYPSGIDEDVLKATDEQQYRAALTKFLEDRDDVTLPSMGWPWPWNDSHTSDYAYTFDAGKVWHSIYIDYPDDFWWPASLPEPDEENRTLRKETLDRCVFPDMSAAKNVTFGDRSGLLFFRA